VLEECGVAGVAIRAGLRRVRMEDPYFGGRNRVFFGGGKERFENFGLREYEFDLGSFDVVREFIRLKVDVLVLVRTMGSENMEVSCK
jgi:hypothetical protein